LNGAIATGTSRTIHSASIGICLYKGVKPKVSHILELSGPPALWLKAKEGPEAYLDRVMLAIVNVIPRGVHSSQQLLSGLVGRQQRQRCRSSTGPSRWLHVNALLVQPLTHLHWVAPYMTRAHDEYPVCIALVQHSHSTYMFGLGLSLVQHCCMNAGTYYGAGFTAHFAIHIQVGDYHPAES